MIKNTAGQVVQCLILTTAGAAFTGTATVQVLGDGGTLSAGGGAVVNEGSGMYSYTPTQAETNYGEVSFMFSGTGAAPAARHYSPFDPANIRSAIGMAAADLDTQLTAIFNASGGLDAAGMRAALGMATANLDTQLGTIAGYIDTEIGSIITDLTAVLTDTGTTLDGKVDAIQALATQIAAKTDSLTFTKAGELDANLQSCNGITLIGDGASTKFGV